MTKIWMLGMLVLLALASCRKEEVVFEDNTVPAYTGVPTVQVNNYVNRLFIDLIGREPLDAEMTLEVDSLEAGGLSLEARTALVTRLMSSTAYVDGDSSYRHAYFFKVYNDLKARMIEGASEGILTARYNQLYSQSIADSLNGDYEAMQRNRQAANRIAMVQSSGTDLRLATATLREVHARMCHNAIYDEINMGSFNFVNASFSDLFDRFPTAEEFDNAYQIIEFNEAAVVFGTAAQNKGEYLDILVNAPEFDEGLVRYVYRSLVSREPTSLEVFEALNDINANLTLGDVQLPVLISDEYAGF